MSSLICNPTAPRAPFGNELTWLRRSKVKLLEILQKRAVFDCLMNSGWRRNRLLILCYHGISNTDEHLWNPRLYMHSQTFAARMELIRRNRCNVLPLDEGVRRLYAGNLPERSVCLTFDDGFHDFHEHAFPILEQYGYPATLYLTTYYCQNNQPVFPLMISYLLWKRRGEMVNVRRVNRGSELLDLRTSASRARILKWIEAEAEENHWDSEQKDQFAAQLAKALGIDYDPLHAGGLLHLMSPEEVTRVADAGIDVQLHTHRHRVPMDRDLFRREIRDNSECIERLTGCRPAHFCYPGGVHRRDFLPWLSGQKIRSGTTCEPALAARERNPLLLPRVVDHSGLSEVEFEGWLCGASAFLPLRRPSAFDAIAD